MMTQSEFDKMQKENCEKKIPYHEITTAEHVKIFANKKFNKVHEIYRCPVCNSLHLKTDKGKSPKKIKCRKVKEPKKVIIDANGK